MKNVMVLFLLLFFATGAGLADTIYLKNGREVQGTFDGFAKDEFTLINSEGNLLRFRANLVERVVIDRDARWRGEESRRLQRGRWERFDEINVGPGGGWVQSPVRVYSGQRLQMEASGTVILEGRTTANPEGLSGKRVRNSPMPNQNAGALIARIGSSSGSPLLFIGRSSEIVADRDGILYFAVNYPKTGDSRGAFAVNVSLERGTGDSTDDWRGLSLGGQKTITINGDQPWTDTAIDLEPNMIVEVSAEGQISFGSSLYAGPDGNRSFDREAYPVRKVGAGAVIAKIRYPDGSESYPYFIGARNQMNSRRNEYGRLFIGINDDNFGDNTGSYRITIRNVSTDRGTGNGGGLPGRALPRGEKVITVYANQPWTDTGVDIEPNRAIEIAAEGQITYSESGSAGPNGGLGLGINNYPIRNAGVGAVIAKVRYRDGSESSLFFIGAGNQLSTGRNEYGRLFIGINDDNFGDNRGSYRVTIRWQ